MTEQAHDIRVTYPDGSVRTWTAAEWDEAHPRPKPEVSEIGDPDVSEIAHPRNFDPQSLDHREYDPMPYPEALPYPESMYEGTGIGALYGLSPMTPSQAASLVGWTITPGRYPE